MEVEVSREELFAVHLWNSTQLIKRKERLRLSKTFSAWKHRMVSARSIQREQLLQDEAELSTQQDEPSQTLHQVGHFNERLREELRQLGEERAEIERATAQVRQELRDARQPGRSGGPRPSADVPF
jgi:septal ring factor EnvC (AmiA/AmiB activator)